MVKCFKNTGIKPRETELLDQRMSFQKKKVFGSCIAILHCRKAKPLVMPTNSV